MRGSTMKTKATKNLPIQSQGEDLSTRILKIANCLSLSGRSTLTYHIGCKVGIEGEGGSANSDVQFRIQGNTARGFFSNEWIPASAIQLVFETLPVNAPVTAAALNAIFQGKSVNTAGFLLAVLKAEGLVVALKDKRRYYERANSDAFVDEINGLIESATALSAGDQPAVISKGAKRSTLNRKEKKD